MIRIPSLACLVALAACGGPDAAAPARPTGAAAAAPRPARTRAAFEQAYLAWHYRRTTPQAAALAAEVDRAAGQRHATASRLFWHEDLAAARTAAAASGRPILALRMLGRLDEDLSCANSRFFRVALYADAEVSALLREHFELVWTSERPVPVARIDFGDGRVLERTVAGNSAHHVLDAEGRPVDVLPGLYSPAMFRAALERAGAVAREVGPLDEAAAAARVRAYHEDGLRRATLAWAGLGSVAVPVEGDTIAAAEARAMTKAMTEIPLVRTLALGGDLGLGDRRLADRMAEAWDQIAARLPAARLDAGSRALFAALSPTDWARAGQPLPDVGVEALIASFERVMARDSAFNEYYLHPAIHGWFAAGTAPRTVEALNARVYDELFLTPADDPWLGMATPGTFTGLPSDGVHVRATPLATR